MVDIPPIYALGDGLWHCFTHIIHIEPPLLWGFP